MFYRVRTRLDDSPGALAELALRCGEAGVNIRALQMYPDLGSVTDDLVVEVPDVWSGARLIELVEEAGGAEVSIAVCSALDLQDQPTHWLRAARALVEDPDALATELTRLLGRRMSLSATERVRVAVLEDIAEALRGPQPPERASSVVEYDETPTAVVARVGDGVVGAAGLVELSGLAAEGSVEVAPAWRRMGVGRQLLRRLCERAQARGLAELTMLAPPTEEGVVPLLAATGLRGRIRLTPDGLQVIIALAQVRPAGAAQFNPPDPDEPAA